jgi:aspartyl-tRNA(Asn)/glutamyl-tRNA(Gln) amidotransferase subunit C
MTLSLAQVEHIAELAHLSLSDDEKLRYQEQLSAILVYASRLQELDTDTIPPTAAILPIDSVMRPDDIEPSIPREDLLRNAPAATEGMLKVPLVLAT